MKRIEKIGLVLLAFFLVAGIAGCLSAETKTTPAPKEIDVNLALVAHGGRLYDKWWGEIGASEPTGDQALWATQDTNKRSGKDTWRCKECHGWDYKGVDGAYSSGSHKTGFPGVFEAALSKSTDELTQAMKSSNHDFTESMGNVHIEHVVLFMKNGLVDMSRYIDYDAKKPKSADLVKGQELFENTCKMCHGSDGKMLNFGSDDDPEYVGTLAADNPWEFTHKVRNGQPGSEPAMPSAIENGWTLQDVMDVLGYAQTLPEK